MAQGNIPQPQNIFFDLTLGGLQRIYSGPNIPVDFLYENILGVQTVEITLFDVTGFEVEPAIYNARNEVGIPSGTFQFGYLGNNPKYSPVYNFLISDYYPTWLHNSFALKIIGSFALTAITSTNSYSGTVQNILQDICTNHKWQLNINPPFGPGYMQDMGYVDKDSTAAMEMRHIKWISESDWSYIQRVIMWARDQEGKGGYFAFLSTNGQQQTILNIIRPNLTAADYTYNVQDPESTVIAWEPNIDFSGAIFNANGTQQNGYQRSTGDEQKTVTDQNVTSPYQVQAPGQTNAPLITSTPPPIAPPTNLTYFNSELMPESVTGSSVRSRPGASISPYAGVNKTLNEQLVAWIQAAEANLTILGDPNIDPIDPTNPNFQTVQVNCYYPVNYNTGNIQQLPHYTSGLWWLKGVRHIIRAGSFQTILHLMTPDTKVPSTNLQQNPATPTNNPTPNPTTTVNLGP